MSKNEFNKKGEKGSIAGFVGKKLPFTALAIGSCILPGPQLFLVPFALAADAYRAANSNDDSKPSKNNPFSPKSRK